MIENIDLIRQIERDQNQAGRSSYPDTYYRLRARVTELRSGMEQIQARVTRLDRQIAVVFAGQSADGFTGRLRPILEDGVPVKSSILAELDMPTTLPTTLPTTIPTTLPTSQPVN